MLGYIVGSRPDPISKEQQKKIGWSCGSSSSVPASKHKALRSNPSTEKKKSFPPRKGQEHCGGEFKCNILDTL
jgi:hypothetical protein